MQKTELVNMKITKKGVSKEKTNEGERILSQAYYSYQSKICSDYFIVWEDQVFPINFFSSF